MNVDELLADMMGKLPALARPMVKSFLSEHGLIIGQVWATDTLACQDGSSWHVTAWALNVDPICLVVRFRYVTGPIDRTDSSVQFIVSTCTGDPQIEYIRATHEFGRARQ